MLLFTVLLAACGGREEKRGLLAPASDLSGIPVTLEPRVASLEAAAGAPEPAGPPDRG